MKSSQWTTKDWDGLNICGNLLMKVREELVGKIDKGDMSIDDINEGIPSSLGDAGETSMEATPSTASPPASGGEKTMVAENTLVRR